ncbi:MAG: dTMP kinase [Treponema sp.]|nr:dTMP kinase [Treponema sp.]
MNNQAAEGREVWDRFIVFEGIDGTGTTTQRHLLSATLTERSIPFHSTAEPTDSEIGRLIRRVLSGDLRIEPETLAYLYAADRNEHLYGPQGIRDHLESGEVVICDRYIFSSLAYQGCTCGLELPDRLNQGFPLPSLLIYFELPPERAVSRISGRGAPDLFERGEFLSQVSRAYEGILERFEAQGMKILRVNGARSIPEVAEDIRKAVLS